MLEGLAGLVRELRAISGARSQDAQRQGCRLRHVCAICFDRAFDDTESDDDGRFAFSPPILSAIDSLVQPADLDCDLYRDFEFDVFGAASL